MVTILNKFFRPPVFDEPEKTAQARSIHIILLCTFALTILFLLYGTFFLSPGQLIIAIVAIVLEFGLLIVVQTKRIQLACWVFNSMLWAAVGLEVALYGGIRDSGFGAFAAIILVAGLTLGTRSSVLFASLTLLAGTGLAVAENQGLLPAYTNGPIWTVLLSHSITLIAVVLLINQAIRSISKLSRENNDNANSEKAVRALLDDSQTELAHQTTALEQRNIALQAITSISRLPSQVKSETDLLEQSAQLLVEKNKLELIGIYLLDQMEEYAILQTYRSEANMLLPTDENKLNVIKSETSDLLIGADALRFKIGTWNYFIDQPKQFPEMNSSLVFPMASADKLIGLMNIQTSSPDPQSMDNPTMQMFADQIGISVTNIRLLKQLQTRDQDMDALKEGGTKNSWGQLEGGRKIGYVYDRLQVIPSDETFPPEVAIKLNSGKSAAFISAGTPPRARLAAPIILREAIIGVIGYDSNIVDHQWQEEERALLETVASRVSLALENTRLVAEAQQRAEQERMISQVTSKMRETLDIETILKTAVQEMRQSLELREAEVRLQMAGESHSTEVNRA